MCDRRLRIVLVLDVFWQDDDGRYIVGLRDPHAPVQEMPHLSRRGSLLYEACNVREHSVQVEFLLVAGAADGRFGLTADSEHRHVIQLPVIQAGDQMCGPRSAGRQADAELAGKLGFSHGHEGGLLLMPDLDEIDVVGPLQSTDHAVDAVAGVSVDAADTPGVQAFDNEIADFHGTLQFDRGCFISSPGAGRSQTLDRIQSANRPPIAAATAVRTAPHAMSGKTTAHSQCLRTDMLVSSNVA